MGIARGKLLSLRAEKMQRSAQTVASFLFILYISVLFSKSLAFSITFFKKIHMSGMRKSRDWQSSHGSSALFCRETHQTAVS